MIRGIDKIQPLDEKTMEMARERQKNLAKPPESLGILEDVSVQIAGITGKVINRVEKMAVVILSADNGVVAEGVSSAPQSVTLAQTINFTKQTTGVGALAKTLDTELMVVDMGINYHIPKALCSDHIKDMKKNKIVNRKLGYGTKNLAKEEAMTREDAVKGIEIGIDLAKEAKEMGFSLLGVGEMGIGNTTTAATLLASLTGEPAEKVVGRGGGITDESFQKKKNIVKYASSQEFQDQVDMLAKVGGFDLAAMTGVFLGCGIHRIPVVIDGYISAVAALLATKLEPKAREYMIPSHDSLEPGYKLAMDSMNLKPILSLNMRLGEGSGCPLAFQVIKGALGVMEYMATFEEANINDSYLEEIRKGDCF